MNDLASPEVSLRAGCALSQRNAHLIVFLSEEVEWLSSHCSQLFQLISLKKREMKRTTTVTIPEEQLVSDSKKHKRVRSGSL